jgi:hypothetical protein
MVGVGGGLVKVVSGFAVLVVAALVAGCFWRSYPERVATHADVLVSMAHKGVDLLAADRFTARTLPELLYPLERGEALAAEARQRSGTEPPPSLAPFEELLARYRAFCDVLDGLRRNRPGADARALLRPALGRIEQSAAAVHAAVSAG